MTTPQPLTKEKMSYIGQFGEHKGFTNDKVWLAAQWLKQELCFLGVPKHDKDVENCNRCGTIDMAFGACRPDAEKKQ